MDFITCTRAPQSRVTDCSLGIMGGSGPFSSYQSSTAEGLTHLPLQDGAGVELGWSWGGGQPKGHCWPSAPLPHCRHRNVSWDNDSQMESDCPLDHCMLLLAKYYFWHHHHSKAQTVTLQPQSARFPEIPAMDEAGDLSHTHTRT